MKIFVKCTDAGKLYNIRVSNYDKQRNKKRRFTIIIIIPSPQRTINKLKRITNYKKKHSMRKRSKWYCYLPYKNDVCISYLRI